MQRNTIDELHHEINLYAAKLAANAQQHAGRVEVTFEKDHEFLWDKYEVFEKNFNELRHEFNEYLGKWM